MVGYMSLISCIQNTEVWIYPVTHKEKIAVSGFWTALGFGTSFCVCLVYSDNYQGSSFKLLLLHFYSFLNVIWCQFPFSKQLSNTVIPQSTLIVADKFMELNMFAYLLQLHLFLCIYHVFIFLHMIIHFLPQRPCYVILFWWLIGFSLLRSKGSLRRLSNVHYKILPYRFLAFAGSTIRYCHFSLIVCCIE